MLRRDRWRGVHGDGDVPSVREVWVGRRLGVDNGKGETGRGWRRGCYVTTKADEEEHGDAYDATRTDD